MLAAGAALVRTQHLQAAQADRVQVLPQLEIDLLAGHAGLAAGERATENSTEPSDVSVPPVAEARTGR